MVGRQQRFEHALGQLNTRQNKYSFHKHTIALDKHIHSKHAVGDSITVIHVANKKAQPGVKENMLTAEPQSFTCYRIHHNVTVYVLELMSV